MVGGDHKFVFAAVAVTVLSAALLSGCASAPSGSAAVGGGDYPDLTLAESKSPVQLLRNEAAGRIPPAIIKSVTETEDVSISCLAEKDDPDGLVRSWHSTVEVAVIDGSAWRVDTVVDELVSSFVSQGWTARDFDYRAAASEGSTGSANVHSSQLKSDSSWAKIVVAGIRTAAAAPSTDETVSVEIQVHGPCVTTEGTMSDEVANLEGR